MLSNGVLSKDENGGGMGKWTGRFWSRKTVALREWLRKLLRLLNGQEQRAEASDGCSGDGADVDGICNVRKSKHAFVATHEVRSVCSILYYPFKATPL